MQGTEKQKSASIVFRVLAPAAAGTNAGRMRARPSSTKHREKADKQELAEFLLVPADTNPVTRVGVGLSVHSGPERWVRPRRCSGFPGQAPQDGQRIEMGSTRAITQLLHNFRPPITDHVSLTDLGETSCPLLCTKIAKSQHAPCLLSAIVFATSAYISADQTSNLCLQLTHDIPPT